MCPEHDTILYVIVHRKVRANAQRMSQLCELNACHLRAKYAGVPWEEAYISPTPPRRDGATDALLAKCLAEILEDLEYT